MNRDRVMVRHSLSGLVVIGVTAGLLMPGSAQAEVKGESDAVVVCVGAHDLDPSNYQRPGFLCEVEPDSVTVGGEVHSVLRYKIQIRKGEGKVKESAYLDYGMEPAPVFVAVGGLEWGVEYQVDYVALLDNGESAVVRNDDFTLQVPRKPGKLRPKLRYGQLNQGIGRGYTMTWKATRRTDGYLTQVRNRGKWVTVEQVGARRVEYGQISRSPIKMRVRAWNSGGKGPWQVVSAG